MFNFFKKKLFSVTSDQLNDYCFDAYKAFIHLNDNEALFALGTCLVVLGEEQRMGMFKALDHYSTAAAKALIDISTTDPVINKVLYRIEEANRTIATIATLSCSMEEVVMFKMALNEKFPNAALALNKFNGNYFKAKHSDTNVFKNN